eukprot:m.50265 g.50265  ORF g.50265 m.50265 type:complete len:908 (-) comp11153_c1_seq2:108-2831(-)
MRRVRLDAVHCGTEQHKVKTELKYPSTAHLSAECGAQWWSCCASPEQDITVALIRVNSEHTALLLFVSGQSTHQHSARDKQGVDVEAEEDSDSEALFASPQSPIADHDSQHTQTVEIAKAPSFTFVPHDAWVEVGDVSWHDPTGSISFTLFIVSPVSQQQLQVAHCTVNPNSQVGTNSRILLAGSTRTKQIHLPRVVGCTNDCVKTNHHIRLPFSPLPMNLHETSYHPWLVPYPQKQTHAFTMGNMLYLLSPSEASSSTGTASPYQIEAIHRAKARIVGLVPIQQQLNAVEWLCLTETNAVEVVAQEAKVASGWRCHIAVQVATLDEILLDVSPFDSNSTLVCTFESGKACAIHAELDSNRQLKQLLCIELDELCCISLAFCQECLWCEDDCGTVWDATAMVSEAVSFASTHRSESSAVEATSTSDVLLPQPAMQADATQVGAPDLSSTVAARSTLAQTVERLNQVAALREREESSLRSLKRSLNAMLSKPSQDAAQQRNDVVVSVVKVEAFDFVARPCPRITLEVKQSIPQLQDTIGRQSSWTIVFQIIGAMPGDPASQHQDTLCFPFQPSGSGQQFAFRLPPLHELPVHIHTSIVCTPELAVRPETYQTPTSNVLTAVPVPAFAAQCPLRVDTLLVAGLSVFEEAPATATTTATAASDLRSTHDTQCNRFMYTVSGRFPMDTASDVALTAQQFQQEVDPFCPVQSPSKFPNVPCHLRFSVSESFVDNIVQLLPIESDAYLVATNLLRGFSVWLFQAQLASVPDEESIPLLACHRVLKHDAGDAEPTDTNTCLKVNLNVPGTSVQCVLTVTAESNGMGVWELGLEVQGQASFTGQLAEAILAKCEQSTSTSPFTLAPPRLSDVAIAHAAALASQAHSDPMLDTTTCLDTRTQGLNALAQLLQQLNN